MYIKMLPMMKELLSKKRYRITFGLIYSLFGFWIVGDRIFFPWIVDAKTENTSAD